MRIARRLVQAVLVVLTLVIGAAAAAIIVSQTSWFRDWLRGYVVRQASQALNGQVSIARLEGNLFFGIELHDVGVTMDGSQIVAVKDLGLDYDVFELIARGLSLDHVRLTRPVVYLRRDGDTWSISRLFKKQTTDADRRGPRRPFSVDEIGVSDGSIVMEQPAGTSGVKVPRRVEHLDASLSVRYEPTDYSIDVRHVSFRGSDPAIGLDALSGGLSVRDDDLFVQKLSLRTEESSLSFDGAVHAYLTKPVFNLRIRSDKLSLPEIARVVPVLAGVGLQPAFELAVSGPTDRLGVDLNVRSSAGQLTGRLTADVASPGQGVSGDLAVRHLDLAPLLKSAAQKSDISASARVKVGGGSLADVNSITGTAHVEAPRVVAAGYAAEGIIADAQVAGRRVTIDGRATAYGATATAAGRVTLPEGREALTYDLRGLARSVDLRRLPRFPSVPPAATDLNAQYHLTGSAAGDRTSADLVFDRSTVAGATIDAGSRASVSVAGSDVAYQADVSVAGVDLARIGREFRIAPLASDRYRSTINGHLIANGEGTTPATMRVTANGALTDSTVIGGRIPRLIFDASVADNTARVKLDGEADQFDPAQLTGKPAIQGTVGGAFSAAATLRDLSRGVTPEGIDATARVDLQPSAIGKLAVTSARLDADYHDSAGVIRTLDVRGRDLNVTAMGTLALSETGQSNLTFHADTPGLDGLGQLVGLKLTGLARIDGALSGNKRELQATGHLVGDDVSYGGFSALTLNTAYTVKVPELNVEQATVTADSTATFASIGGQDVNELHARTDYGGQQVVFDATAKQPQRSMEVGGAILVHPDHQEVHLERLQLTAQNVMWRLAAGTHPAVQYGNGAVTIDRLDLVNAGQTIEAAGTFGRAGESLTVSLTNIDLAGIDTLLLRPPQFSGRLSATSTISGTTDAPAIDARFEVGGGGFRQFRYETLDGTLDYRGGGVDLDARLQQNATTWLTARGYVPMALFKGTAARETLPREDRVDLHIDSSPIDLGLVQGFTTALNGVTGTMQAKIDVGGSAADPHPIGAITVRNGAFTVASTGVTYTDFGGTIDLQPDRVHIDGITVLDNQKKPLMVSGDLAVHARQVSGVDVAVKADDFKVLDNQLGNVRINTDLRLVGELAYPRVEGSLGITTGTVNLDPIVASTGESAYATKPAEYQAQGRDDKGQIQAARPTPYDALQVDVRLTVPGDLVLKGQDLQPSGAAVGLGAINVTVGGDLYVSKAPYDQVRLTGTVNTVRGWYDFQGRRFTILRDGTVKFEGLDDIDPELDVRTERVIQAVDAKVTIGGTLKKPAIKLSSTPPLEQADIMSLIVFNQPINQLGEGQQISVVQRAQALATGAVAGQLSRSLEKVLNVNQFEINTASQPGAPAQLTIGQQIGQNVYVKLEQGIGDQSTTNFVFEYELTPWLRLQTNVLQGSQTQQQLFQRIQGSGADLLFFFSY